MGKFLKVIGTPFIKLWTWIKETAWVQPLLIVGIIFAIIFSIPSITSWVQSWNFGSDSYTFLKIINFHSKELLILQVKAKLMISLMLLMKHKVNGQKVINQPLKKQ